MVSIACKSGVVPVSDSFENETQYLRFDYPNVGYVIDGLEDATVRFELDRDFEEGEWVQARTPENNVFGYIEIEKVSKGPIRSAQPKMCYVDGREHPSTSPNDLLERLERHYPDAEIALRDDVSTVYFDFVQAGPTRGNISGMEAVHR